LSASGLLAAALSGSNNSGTLSTLQERLLASGLTSRTGSICQTQVSQAVSKVGVMGYSLGVACAIATSGHMLTASECKPVICEHVVATGRHEVVMGRDRHVLVVGGHVVASACN